MSQEMFEKLIRAKTRFASPQGALSIEDLYDLPLTSSRPNQANLGDIARGLSKDIQALGPEDFGIELPEAKDDGLKLKFEAVKHVINAILADRNAQTAAALTRARRQQILDLIAQKENAAMSEKSIDELRALIESL